jgi:hypothetical protein
MNLYENSVLSDHPLDYINDVIEDELSTHSPYHVGSTSATVSTVDKFSAYPVVSIILDRCVKEISSDVLAGVSPIVESLIWPFVCRFKGFSSTKEMGRFESSMKKTAKRISELFDHEDRQQVFVKYWLDFFMCRVVKDSVFPPKPVWITQNLFCGWISRCISRAIARRDVAFLYSLQKGSKLMWPQLSPLKYIAAMKDSMKNIGLPKGRIGINLRKQIIDFSKFVFKKLKTPTRFMPSSAACLQASRTKGGALSVMPQMTKVDPTTIGSLRRLPAVISEWKQFSFDISLERVQRKIDEIAIDKHGKEFYPMLDVHWLGLYEPAKIRPIGYMDGYLCTVLRAIQGQMLSCWKKNISSTMRNSDSDLTDRVRQLDDAVDEEFWCSGDYKNATDLLKRDASLTALSVFKEHPLYYYAYRSLGFGRIVYPDGPDANPYKNGSTIEQFEGQLMGNPLSFPLLCVINKAVYYEALQIWLNIDPGDPERYLRYNNMKRNVIVNGDDILFKGPKDLIEIFKKVANEAGFQISVGKNYVSPDFCQINSQIFIRRNGIMSRKGYLNLRLVKGTNIKEGESSATPLEIGKSLSEMVRLCKWSASSIPYAMMRVSKRVKGWFKPSWYLPVHLGGYGIDRSLMPSEQYFTRDQRKVAAHFIRNPDLRLLRKSVLSRQKLDKLPDGFLSSKIVFGSYVPEISESFETEDQSGWTALMSTYNRLYHQTWKPPPKEEEPKGDMVDFLLTLTKVSKENPNLSIREKIQKINELEGTDDGLFLLNVAKLKGLKPISLDSVQDYLKSRIVIKLRFPIPPPMPIFIGIGRRSMHFGNYLPSARVLRNIVEVE